MGLHHWLLCIEWVFHGARESCDRTELWLIISAYISSTLINLPTPSSATFVGWDNWNITSQNVMRELFSAFLLSRLDYCNSRPWDCSEQPSLHIVFLHRMMLCDCLWPYCCTTLSTSNVRLVANLLRIWYVVAQLMYTAFNGLCPENIKDAVN